MILIQIQNILKKEKYISIKNISEECAISVQFEEDNKYYVYVNSYYKSNTLKEFIEDLNIKENISFI